MKQRDLGSPDVWRYSQERAVRNRAARRRNDRVRRITVPLVVAAATAGISTPNIAQAHKNRAAAKTKAAPLRILRLGTIGTDVAHLQRALGVVIDGVFGRLTERAVKRYQHRHGLLVDGQVGPHTRAALRAERRGSERVDILRLGSAGAEVVSLQRRLGVAADGVFGRQTLRAVHAFQANHGLLADGQVGAQTRAALHLAEGTMAKVQTKKHHHHDGQGGSGQGSAGAGGQAGAGSGIVGQRVVAIAKRYLGIPYRWGGASPSTGFDCSGLTMYVYAKVGISLAHYTGSQWNTGRHVSRSQLRPGDLVFFTPSLGHMGMYIGGGRFIHSPHTGDVVKISSLSDSWYSSQYQGAVRVT